MNMHNPTQPGEFITGIDLESSNISGRELAMASTKTPQKSDSESTLAVLRSVAQGNVIPGDIVHAWLASWGTANELPPPVVPAVASVPTEPPQSQG